jgi:putative FmdB family regulatory protein
MPIYEYRCKSCGHELEALQKFSDTPLVDCPSCNAASLTKLISAVGFHLKGSGWYATDFKGSGKPADAKAASKPAEPAATGDAKPAAGGSESKGDSTPAPACGSGGCASCS